MGSLRQQDWHAIVAIFVAAAALVLHLFHVIDEEAVLAIILLVLALLLFDNIRQGGVFGLNLDANHGIYFMTDGTDVYADLHSMSLRSDTLSMANVEKFGGRPSHERIDIGDDLTDVDYRNLVSRLLSIWNYQQLAIFRVDS